MVEKFWLEKDKIMEEKIGIVIPFYNGHKYLDRLIESFDVAAAGRECFLYIIDNSPKDKVVEIKYLSEIPVQVVREMPAIGYGKASNKGFELCKERGYDYVIISNQDAYVSPNFISELLAPFNRDVRIAISAPLLRTYDGNSMEDFFVRYYLSQVPEMISDLILGNAKEFYEIEKISGACFAFRLNNGLYKYPYLFDPIFHMYMEDEDLCFRIRSLDEKIVLCTKPVFYHQHSHTTDLENRELIEADKLTSEYILRLKNNSKSSYRTLYGIMVATTSQVAYHVLRGEFAKAFKHIKTFGVTVSKFPTILKIRKEDFRDKKVYSDRN
jgi:GT2 family glycosyltransferase